MVTLKDIRKEYDMGEEVVHALRGVSIDFRDSEFVAILGPSGCGKTTLLNIIGGLDSYTSGDLVIDGVSTKEFRDAQWDAYRNHSVGFVFQAYNLIPHQTVLANVELALKLSHDLSASERRDRAMQALEAVGLADQAKKKPAMMSGGQMQRVAIARALVNDPQIILADEPTGALDSQTSVQVMDILRDVAKDRLVIMVTHNPELAEQYATRIVRLKDGGVVGDSAPVAASELVGSAGELPKRTRLGMGTALGLSLQNLLTKKGRTFLTAFAGAIGIIGIALILALSNGVNDYIASVEQDTMGNYPVELERETMSFSIPEGGGPSLTGDAATDLHNLEAVYSNNVVADTVRQRESMTVTNDLGAFRSYLVENLDQVEDSVSAIEYGYGVTPQVYRLDEDEEPVQVSPSSLLSDSSSGMSMGGMTLGSSNSSAWQQLPVDEGLRERGYEVLAGRWPESAEEAALIVTEGNEVSDYVLYTLGLMDIDHMNEVVEAVKNGEEVDDPQARIEYEDVLGMTFSVLSPCQYYAENEDGVWYDASEEDGFLREAYDEGIEVEIVGIMRMGEDAQLSSGVAYDARLAERLMEVATESDVVQAQLADPEVNVLTGEEFEEEDEDADEDEEEEEMTSEAAYTADDAESGIVQAAQHDDASSKLAQIQTAVQVAKRTTSVTPVTASATRATAAAVYALADVTLQDVETVAGAADSQGEHTNVTDGELSESTNTNPSAETTLTTSADMPSGFDPNAIDAGSFTGGSTGEPSQPDGNSEEQDDETKPYVVTFVNYDGSALSMQHHYNADEEVTNLPTTDPTRPADATQTYLFIGWVSVSEDETLNGRYYTTATLPKVTASVTYQALYYAMPVSSDSSQGVPGQGGMPNGGGSVTPNMDALSGLSGTNVQNLSGMDLSKYMNGLDASAMSGMDASALSGMDLSSISGSAVGTTMSDGQLQVLLAGMSDSTPSTYAEVLEALGYATVDQPSSIALYPVDFAGKSVVEDFIAAYNEQASDAEQVTYTDMVGLMVSSITTIVDTISYVLIAFVAISLVVSSIMIAIITYISVLERTKEIGVLRALGASKGDVSKIFNAETLIEGLLAGLIGVGVTVALCVPINHIVKGMVGVDTIAKLPAVAGVALVGISVVLTLVAGFIPSRVASRKDPAVSLRSE